jgi:cell wall-associated NlpC family hydrolase
MAAFVCRLALLQTKRWRSRMALSPCEKSIFSSRPKHLPEAGGAESTPEGTLHNMTLRQRFAMIVFTGSLVCTGVVAGTAGSAAAAPLSTESIAATYDLVATTAATALAAIGTDRYSMRLEDTSYVVAARLEVDATRLHQAWVAADQSHQVALLSALTQIGVPYHRNSSKVGIAFDCSGLTAFAWAQSGLDLARNSSAQLRAAAPRTIDTAHAGDLVYFPGHVMLWLGIDNLIVHAPSRGHDVEVGQISNRSVRRVKFGDPTA